MRAAQDPADQHAGHGQIGAEPGAEPTKLTRAQLMMVIRQRVEELVGEIEAALKYVESIREVSAADWAEIEQLGAETRRLIAGLKAA
jgi:cell division ATPase FtsA